MAERKPLFIGAFGSEEIHPTNDTVTFKGLTLGTDGLNMQSNPLYNVPTPTLGHHAANKDYVDAVATGLDLKASVRVLPTADFSTYTAAGSGVGATLTAPTNSTTHNTQDGVLLVVGNRVLVATKGGSLTTPNADNGIYTVTTLGDGGSNSLTLTRATDFDQNAEVTAGSFTFVTEGTTNADTGWVLVTNDPITIDTTALRFSQFSSANAVSYGAGLLLTSNVVDVELDTAAGAQTAGADGGSSGLEFDTSGAAGKLRAKVDPAGGIQRLAAGLALEIDDTPDTLDVDADGLKVVGLPSLFKVNDVAVGANVTAANLDTLVNGILSSADALHRHGKLEQAYNVDAAVTAGDPVYFSSNDEVTKADAAGGVGTGQKVIGVARTTQASIGSATQVVRHGPCAGVLSGATAGAPYWLASGGGLTATAPTGNVDRVLVGYAINATDLDVRIQYMGKMLA